MDSSEFTTDETLITLKPRMPTAASLLAYLAPYFVGSGQEEVHVLCFDKHDCLLEHRRFPAGLERATAYGRVLLSVLQVRGTASFVLAEGHPRASPVPKVDERDLRTRVTRALGHAGIACRDHVGFGLKKVWSLRRARTFELAATPRVERVEATSPSA